MSGKSLHRVRVIVQPSFPNNRLSNRSKRRKVITKRVWKEDFDFQYNTRPEPAFIDPFEIPTLFNCAPVQCFAVTSSEVYGALSPTSNDTDGDGLFDGPDVAWEYSLDGKFHRGEESVGTEPLNPDTDGDSANDGQEIFGYDLVWMSIAADATVKEHYVKGVKSDPLDGTNRIWSSSTTGIKDTTTTTQGRDLDGDGITDYNEVHYAEAYPEIVAWANTKQKEWEVANQSYQAGTSTEDPPRFNAEEYLSNQFNPFVAESLPPIILWMDVDTVYDYHYEYGFVKIVDAYWASVTVEVFDPSPMAININVGNGYAYYSTGMLPFGGTWNITIPMQLQYPGMYTGGYEVNVTVYDSNLHYAYMEKEMDGMFSGAIKFFEGVWNGIVGTFAKAWEAVKGAMSWVVELCISIAERMFNKALEPIITLMNNWYAGFINLITQITAQNDFTTTTSPDSLMSNQKITAYGDTDEMKYARQLFDYLLIPIILLNAVSLILVVIETIISGMSFGSAQIILTVVAGALGTLLLTTLGGSIIKGVISPGSEPNSLIEALLANDLSEFPMYAALSKMLFMTIAFFINMAESKLITGWAKSALGLLLMGLTSSPSSAKENMFFDLMAIGISAWGLVDMFKSGSKDVLIGKFSKLFKLTSVILGFSSLFKGLLNISIHYHDNWYNSNVYP